MEVNNVIGFLSLTWLMGKKPRESSLLPLVEGECKILGKETLLQPPRSQMDKVMAEVRVSNGIACLRAGSGVKLLRITNDNTNELDWSEALKPLHTGDIIEISYGSDTFQILFFYSSEECKCSTLTLSSSSLLPPITNETNKTQEVRKKQLIALQEQLEEDELYIKSLESKLLVQELGSDSSQHKKTHRYDEDDDFPNPLKTRKTKNSQK